MTTVLVVDAQAAVRELIVTRLRMDGYGVLEADDGLQAQRVIENDLPDILEQKLRL